MLSPNTSLIHHIQYFVLDRAVETKRQQQKDTAMEVADDVCQSEGLCDVMCDALSNQPEHEESMETHVSEEEPASTANSAPAPEDAHLSGATHSDANPPKPRYSYRLVRRQVACKHWIFSGFFFSFML